MSSTDIAAMTRGAGRTKALVERLEPDTIVVVHTTGMRYYIEQMIRDLNPRVAKEVEVISISSRGDSDRLKGTGKRVVFDHACFQDLPSNVQREEMSKAVRLAQAASRRSA